MKSVLKIQTCIILAIMMGGCVSSYIGQRYEPTTKVTVVSGKIPPQYKIIGKDARSFPGSYTGYEIKQKLIDEAKSVGADAIHIVSSKSIETGSYSMPSGDSPGFDPTSASGAGNWNPDGTKLSTNSFGQTSDQQLKTVKTYETIVKAYFLRLRTKPSGKELQKQQNSDIEQKQLANQKKEK